MDHTLADEIFPDDSSDNIDGERRRMSDKFKTFRKSRRHEEKIGSFRCAHCLAPVPISTEMGTSHRNHCNTCLWSKHVDEETSGDRKSNCHAGMKPIGVTLKHEGIDKYSGQEKLGDVMLIHLCTGCDDVSINRIAADDNIEAIMEVFRQSVDLPTDIRDAVELSGIEIYGIEKRDLIEKRLLGSRKQ